jgi:hypothetical protein
MTWGGPISGTTETWQNSLALDKDPSEGSTLAAVLDPNNPVWTDLKDDVQAYFAGETAISGVARLHWVKFAAIGANGKYTSSPVMREINGGVGIGGGGGGSAPSFPLQTACAITLTTATILSRVKGRFYLPAVSGPLGTDGRMSVAWAEEVQGRAKTFLDNVANQPGIDVLDLRAVVASGTRADGLGAQNHAVTGVTVGRTLDTIRRRRNRLPEAYVPVDPVS